MTKNKKILFIIYIVLLIIACLFGVFYYSNGNNTQNGVAMYYPQDGMELSDNIVVTGHAYAKNGIDSFSVVASNDNATYEFPGEFDSIYDGDDLILTLSSFSS